jgi:hypothetical protein
VGIYSLEPITLRLSLLKWISIDFKTFEMDEYCTKIVFMNQKSRILELYSVKWEYDKSSIDAGEYAKLDDAAIEEDDKRY